MVVATAMVGTRSWIGGLFTRSNRRQDKSVDYTLSPLQVSMITSFIYLHKYKTLELVCNIFGFVINHIKEERLQRLQDRMLVPYDETRPDHQVGEFPLS